MPHLRLKSSVISIAAMLLAGVLPASEPTIPPSSATHGHFVVLGAAGGETVPYARLVMDGGYACPRITGGPKDVQMTSRDNPHLFPVIVCEAVVGFDQTLAIELQDRSLALPTVRENPSRIVAFGDTGCKRYSAKSNTGCAPGTPAQPFASLASAAAVGPAPDVILHMGDYNYRGTGSRVLFTVGEGGQAAQVPQWSYDAGDSTKEDEGCLQGEWTVEKGKKVKTRFWSQNAANSNAPDTWEAWRDDFFTAARDLLPTAPWVFARGNHELCSRAGPGWFYFLDPHSNLTGQQLSCPVPDPALGARLDVESLNVVLSQPYAVDLGTLTLLVLDSANACDSFTDPAYTAAYAEQMSALGELAPSGGHAWMMTHRPIWGVTSFSSKESTGCTDHDKWGCINQTLQAALQDGLDGAFPTSVRLNLAGHMHRFQSVTFDDGRPPVVVVGTGGVALDPSQPLGKLDVPVGGEAADSLTTGAQVESGGKALPAFGYLEIAYAKDGTWKGSIHSPPEGLTLAECGTKQQAGGSVCKLGSGVSAE
ncbi:MAG: hypothetical protein GY719_20065 [bacterium]|nr:hypothetical protein [bacterium]